LNLYSKKKVVYLVFDPGTVAQQRHCTVWFVLLHFKFFLFAFVYLLYCPAATVDYRLYVLKHTSNGWRLGGKF
jgi:hypothetical protein